MGRRGPQRGTPNALGRERDIDVLDTLARSPGALTASEVAADCGRDQGSVSRALRRLVAMGLVEQAGERVTMREVPVLVGGSTRRRMRTTVVGVDGRRRRVSVRCDGSERRTEMRLVESRRRPVYRALLGRSE